MRIVLSSALLYLKLETMFGTNLTDRVCHPHTDGAVSKQLGYQLSCRVKVYLLPYGLVSLHQPPRMPLPELLS